MRDGDGAATSEASISEAEPLDGGVGEDPWWAKRNREDGGCGDRLYYTAPWSFEVNFPGLGIQAQWELEHEREAGADETALQGTFVYRGAERDDRALRCKLNEPCMAGGSRLRLSGGSGELVLHLHLAPNELPAIAEGSKVVLAAAGSGELTLTDGGGTLLVGLVRPGAWSNYPAVRSYKLGAFDISKGPAVCFATQDMCNYRLTVHEIVVRRDAGRWQLAPGERVTAQIDGTDYQIENHFAAQNGIAKPDRETCAAGKTELDSISIVREP